MSLMLSLQSKFNSCILKIMMCLNKVLNDPVAGRFSPSRGRNHRGEFGSISSSDE